MPAKLRRLIFFGLSLKAGSSTILTDALPHRGFFCIREKDPITHLMQGSAAALANLIVESRTDTNTR